MQLRELILAIKKEKQESIFQTRFGEGMLSCFCYNRHKF